MVVRLAVRPRCVVVPVVVGRPAARGSKRRSVIRTLAIVAGAINSSAAELRVFSLLEGAAEHCGIDVMSMQAEYVFDWAARVLGGVRG